MSRGLDGAVPETTPELRTLLRVLHGWSKADRTPVVVVVGGELEAVGEGWHYETKGGRRIHHPSAYAKFGWSSMTYVASSFRLEVGEDLLDALWSALAVRIRADLRVVARGLAEGLVVRVAPEGASVDESPAKAA